MDLGDVDLNLLVVLDAILRESNVSRAGDRLGLSQPATSAALARCRNLFGDGLIQRRGGAMEPTAKALALREPLRAFLAATTRLVTPAQAKLADIRQVVRIVTADHMALCIAEALLPWRAEHAPGLDLVFMPWLGPSAGFQELARGHADLMVSPQHIDTAEDLRQRPLLQERWTLLMRTGHPYFAAPSLESWLAYPHVVMSGRGEGKSPLDDTLAAWGLKRRLGMVVPNFLIVPNLVAGTEMIAMTPSRCLRGLKADTVALAPPPIPIDDFTLQLFWHSKRDGDLAVSAIADVLPGLL